jgi:hypothetical protein
MAVDALVSQMGFVAVIVSAVATAAAALFTAWQVVQMRHSRMVDTFLNVYASANEDHMRAAATWVKYEMPAGLAYEAAIKERRAWDSISAVVHYFEMVGVLVLRRYISADLVYDQMGPWVAGTWEKLHSLVDGHRKAKKSPDYGENFELLAQGFYEWVKSNPPKLEKRPRLSQQHAERYYQGSAAPAPEPAPKDASAPPGAK